MKLLIETTLASYLVALIHGNQVKDHIFHAELKQKSDFLAEDVATLLKRHQLSPSALTGIFATAGPGSFMGVRAGLLFGFTLAKTAKVPFYTASSLDFVAGGKPGEYYLDAKGGMSFTKEWPNGVEKLVAFRPSSALDVQAFLAHPQNYLAPFALTTKPIPNYLKEPRVN